MAEYQLDDRLWAVKLVAFFALLIAALSGPHWCGLLFFAFVGLLILHYAAMLAFALVARMRTASEERRIRRQMRAMNRIERDAFERELVRQVNENPADSIVPATGVSFLVMGRFGFASGARMQREMAAVRQNPRMRRLTDAEQWRAQIEHRQPRDVDAIIAYWRQHTG